MNKWTKGFLIAAGGMLVGGCLIFVLGRAFGGEEQMRTLARDGQLPFHSFSWYKWYNFDDVVDWAIDHNDSDEWDHWDYVAEDSYELDNNFEVFSGNYENDEIKGSQVKNLEIMVGDSELNLKKWDKDSFKITADYDGKLQYYLDGNVLHLTAHRNKYQDKNKITIYVPENQRFDDVSIDVGAIDAKIDKMDANSLDVQIGAGELDVDDLTAQGVSMNIGAGTIHIRNMDVDNIDASVGVGQAIIEGRINGNAQADCSMGQILMKLSGKMSDHEYDIDCSMGAISVGGRNYAGVDSAQTIHSDSANGSLVTLSCSMGSIDVKFDEDL